MLSLVVKIIFIIGIQTLKYLNKKNVLSSSTLNKDCEKLHIEISTSKKTFLLIKTSKNLQVFYNKN